MNSKLRLTSYPASNVNSLTFSESEPDSLSPMRWVGINDLVEGRKLYQKKEYESAFKCFGIGLAKLGVLTAASYGSYKWFFGNVVHLNEFITEAEMVFQKRSSESFAPNAVTQLIAALYQEQRKFKMWPKSGQDFFLKHLDSNYPMSAAIIETLLINAAKQNDSSFQNVAIKKCASATHSTLSCIKAANTILENANQDRLSAAMSILNKCSKRTNAFCDNVLENGMKLSIEQQEFSDISSLASKLLKGNFKIDPSKVQTFANDAGDLFFQNIENKKQKAEDCRIAEKNNAKKGSPDWERCYAYAGFFDRFDEIDRPWNFEERFLPRKTKELESELMNDLQNGEHIAMLHSRIQGSSKFVIQLFDSFIEGNMMDEAMRLLEKNPAALRERILPMLDRLKNKNRWDVALQMIVNISKKHPQINLKDQVQIFTQDLLKSSQAHLAFTLLSSKDAIDLLDVKAILQKAFENTEEDHLHKVYLQAKSWIAKKDPRYDVHLEFIIDQMFAATTDRWSYYHDPLNQIMAKTLATQWILSKDPNRWTRLDLSGDWDLNRRDGSRWDAYSSDLNKGNWKQLAGIHP